jgi:hypothetical protein
MRLISWALRSGSQQLVPAIKIIKTNDFNMLVFFLFNSGWLKFDTIFLTSATQKIFCTLTRPFDPLHLTSATLQIF